MATILSVHNAVAPGLGMRDHQNHHRHYAVYYITSLLQLSRGSIQSDLTQEDMHRTTHFFPVAR